MEDTRKIQLLCEIEHADNLQQICNLAYELMGNPVFISDYANTTICYTDCVEIPDPTWETDVINSTAEEHTMQEIYDLKRTRRKSTSSQLPVLIDDDYIPYPRLIKSLIYKGKPIGYLVCTSFFEEFVDGDREFLELIASFVIPMLTQEHYHIANKEHTIENYFIKILSGSHYRKELVDKHLKKQKFILKKYCYLFTVDTLEASSDEPESLTRLVDIVSSRLLCNTFVYDSSIICIYRTDTVLYDPTVQIPVLSELLDEFQLAIGISCPIEDFSQLYTYYEQALDILNIGCKLGRRTNCYPYERFSSFLLIEHIPINQLDLYCHKHILLLDEYDQKHHTELCITLQVFLEEAKNLSKTAETLFIHRNTVRYRINRCMEILGNHIDDGNDIFSYILSLRILEYKKKC